MKSFLTLSRNLRKSQTPWEAKLWRALRNRNFSDLKFRRQHRIGEYIVDFYCPAKKLIIELDGSHHNEKMKYDKDAARDQYLRSKGYKILRTWNNDIDHNLEGVIQRILEY